MQVLLYTDYMADIKKITFLTGHSWHTNRQGGFHQFAKAACDAGIETVFFSFPRPYYNYFTKQELYNRKSIQSLTRGIEYKTGRSVLHNITLPTFKLPNAAGRILSDSLLNALERTSLHSFSALCRTYIDGTDIFVFESCDGIIFFDRLKRMYPNARFIYRPSDPMMIDGAPSRYVTNETHIMRNADLNIIVNDTGLALYRKKIADFDRSIRYTVLSNGVDIESYETQYPVPEPLQKPNTVVYIGAWEVEWDLLFTAADATPDFNYVVVCPNYPDNRIIEKVQTKKNLDYIRGISPSEVPAWVTNSRVIMVPYKTDFYKARPYLGITAKYYQAMAARRPIVSYADTPALLDIGVRATYTYDDFINAVTQAMQEKERSYTFDLSNRRWDTVNAEFLRLAAQG